MWTVQRSGGAAWARPTIMMLVAASCPFSTVGTPVEVWAYTCVTSRAEADSCLGEGPYRPRENRRTSELAWVASLDGAEGGQVRCCAE